jgi:protease I
MGLLTGKKVLMILAPKDFRDEEYFKTRVVLQGNGAQVLTTAQGVEEATGVLGGKAKVDLSLDKVVVDDYEAIVFIGGPGAQSYFTNKKVLALASRAVGLNKVVGAICIAPSILANAGVLQNKKVTSFSSEEKNLKQKGAKFTGKDVEVDGEIVTASGPQVAEAFGQELVKLLK